MAIAGKGGGVYVSTNKVAEVKNWSLDIEADMLDSTTFDSNGWRQFIAGLKQWSGSFDLEWKMSDTSGQKALQDAILGGTTVTLKLDVNGTNNYSGTAFMSKEGLETPVDDIVSGSFDYQGSGALTYT